MDGPTVSIDAREKQHKAFKIAALCICIAAVCFGLIDLNAGYHRVGPTCFSAAATCYFVTALWAASKHVKRLLLAGQPPICLSKATIQRDKAEIAGIRKS
jgi:hypothetical protein